MRFDLRTAGKCGNIKKAIRPLGGFYMTDTKKEILRSVKFVLFSISAGLIQVASFTLMEELTLSQKTAFAITQPIP